MDDLDVADESALGDHTASKAINQSCPKKSILIKKKTGEEDVEVIVIDDQEEIDQLLDQVERQNNASIGSPIEEMIDDGISIRFNINRSLSANSSFRVFKNDHNMSLSSVMYSAVSNDNSS